MLLRLAVIGLLLFFFGCSSDRAVSTDTEPASPAASTSPAPAAAPTSTMNNSDKEAAEPLAATVDTSSVIADIRSVYATAEAEVKGGSFQRDTFDYQCEETQGGMVVFRDGTTIQYVQHWQVWGDHAGQTEHIYFKDRQPVFYFKEEGSWTFGGPPGGLDNDDGMPGTIDKVLEERIYLSNGNIVRALSKAYELKSWEDGPDPEAIPNQPMENPSWPEWSIKQIEALTADGRLDCAEVDV